MKKLWVGVLVVLLLVTPILAVTEDNTFSVGESFMIKNRNVSVLQIDSKNDKIVVCVNNVKDIVSDEKTVNDVFIDIRSVDSDSAELRLSYKCDSSACFCEGLECTNQLCFPKEESSDDEVVVVTPPTSNSVKEIEIVKSDPVKSVESSRTSFGFVFFTILLVVLVIILIVASYKKE